MIELNWGIIGSGKIADKFVQDLKLASHNNAYGIASRSEQKAMEFASRHDIPFYAGSYEELLENDEINVVYVATPHHNHAEWAIKAMEAGKHVLCEKPMAVNCKDIVRMIQSAKSNNVFLMEAMWTRFNPTIIDVVKKIQSGFIGSINRIDADFFFRVENIDENSRLVNMDLAGGALLDIGIYPIFLNYLLLGMPKNILSTSLKHKTGADIHTSIILEYPVAIGTASCGFTSDSEMIAGIYGSEGTIFIDSRWHEPQGYRLLKDGENHDFKIPKSGKGYVHEIEECYSCIMNDKRESTLWSLDDSLNIGRIMDEVRNQIGLKYPFE